MPIEDPGTGPPDASSATVTCRRASDDRHRSGRRSASRVYADVSRRYRFLAASRFSPSILPPYMRRSKSIETLLPIPISEGYLGPATSPRRLAALLGKDAAGLSASAVGRLKDGWLDEHNSLAEAPIGRRRATSTIWLMASISKPDSKTKNSASSC